MDVQNGCAHRMCKITYGADMGQIWGTYLHHCDIIPMGQILLNRMCKMYSPMILDPVQFFKLHNQDMHWRVKSNKS